MQKGKTRMKVVFDPPSEIFTGTPLEIRIEEVDSAATITAGISKVGKIPLRCRGGSCQGFFVIPTQGTYELSVQRTPDRESFWSKTVKVEEAVNLSFAEEFGLFCFLLGTIFLGVILWINQKHRKTIKRI